MQDKSRLKLISMLMGVFLYTGAVPAHALGGALTGAGDVSQGAREWANNCGGCHNLRSPTEFTSDNWETIMMHMRIQAGVSGQVARDIYAFLSGQGPVSQGGAASAGTQAATAVTPVAAGGSKSTAGVAQAAQVKAAPGKSGSVIFHQTCVTCHGSNGKGSLPGAPDFTSPAGPLKKPDETLLKHIINGYQAPGSSMAMPPKGGNSALSDADAKAVLSYIRSAFSK